MIRREKIIKADKDIYEIFSKLEVNEEEKFKIIGNLVKDLGYLEIGEDIINKNSK